MLKARIQIVFQNVKNVMKDKNLTDYISCAIKVDENSLSLVGAILLNLIWKNIKKNKIKVSWAMKYAEINTLLHSMVLLEIYFEAKK